MESISYNDFSAAETILASHVESEEKAPTVIESTHLVYEALQNTPWRQPLLAAAPALIAGAISSCLPHSEISQYSQWLNSEPSLITGVSDALVGYDRVRNQTPLIYTSVKDDFEIIGTELVQSYLAKNLDLQSWLLSFKNDLSSQVNNATISLEHYKDVDEHWEKLLVNIYTGSDDLDFNLDLEDKIVEDYIAPNYDLLEGRLVIAVSASC